MRFLREEIVFQEVPNETSILFQITNCPNNCPGCHSANINAPSIGRELTDNLFENIILDYRSLATCILFWGGEWEEQNLVRKLHIARDYGFKTCLYTGRYKISKELQSCLNYVKLGPYIEHLGGLSSPTSNQRFINLDTGENLNNLFQTNSHYIKMEETFYDKLKQIPN